MVLRVFAALAALLLLVAPAAAQSPVLSLGGVVGTPLHLTLDALQKMPSEQQAAVYTSGHGPVTASYTGVTLWSLIEKAGGIADTSRGAAARHTIRVTASDGYAIVLSTGEIAPDLGDVSALVAYARDGKPLDEFTLVMPGDKIGDRTVHDVVTIAVE